MKYAVGKPSNRAGKFRFSFPRALLYQSCNEGCPESAERNPILAGREGASGWAASAPQCVLDQVWASLASLSQYLSQEVRVPVEMSQLRLEKAVKIRHLYCYFEHMD